MNVNDARSLLKSATENTSSLEQTTWVVVDDRNLWILRASKKYASTG